MWHDSPSVILPDWPAPGNVTALVTTRHGGVSTAPHDDFNLAYHVGDRAEAVNANRAALREMIGGVPVAWVRQVHGTRMVEARDARDSTGELEADAVRVRRGEAAAVMTADCLPIFLVERSGSEAAVIHAGWRGLASGIIRSAIAGMECQPPDLMAWLGPAIGPCHFEVGGEVRKAFMKAGAGDCASAFRPSVRPGHWMADLYALARIRLHAAGVDDVHGGGFCTFCDRTQFYSYRRDGTTGRMAALIRLNK